MLDIGTKGPDFTLTGAQGEEIREFTLSEFAGDHPTVLLFYIYDYNPVCASQVCEVNDAEFLTFNDDASVLGISTDGPYSHLRFIDDNDLSYPLLTDDGKRVYEEYGMVELADDGIREPKRGLVLLDSDRIIRYRWEAADKWAEWDPQPLTEINSRIDDLVGGEG